MDLWYTESCSLYLELKYSTTCNAEIFIFYRAVSILPNRFLGVVGQHDDDFPVENLSLSRDGLYLASCSHDQTIKFWNLEDVKKEKVNTKKKAKKSQKTKSLNTTSKSDFFAGFEEDNDKKENDSDKDEDDSDDYEDVDDEDDSDSGEEND